MTGRLFPAEVNRPSRDLCFSRDARHFAALRAGLITIAPPALGTHAKSVASLPSRVRAGGMTA